MSPFGVITPIIFVDTEWLRINNEHKTEIFLAKNLRRNVALMIWSLKYRELLIRSDLVTDNAF